MPDPSESRVLVDRCRRGDGGAARELFDRYVGRLVAVARRRLTRRVTSRVDPEDIVQSVFRTFFGRLQAGQFHLDQQDDLLKVLVRITVNKTLQQVAFQKAAKRDPGQEAHAGNAEQEQVLGLLAREPAPEEAAAFLDELEHFLAHLDPQERRILEMRLQGYSNEDICRELGIYDRKIRRVVERLRGLAEQEGWAPGDTKGS
jgi:RNA polymerase sigma-70 factor (ECF subfamily)